MRIADRFEELRTYLAVVVAGGVNAAADELGIAKSAASRRLADLEARVGVRLIERSTRRFELTQAGHAYASRAAAILADLARLDASFEAATRPALRIEAPADLIRHVLAAAVVRWRENLDRPGEIALATGPDQGEPDIRFDATRGQTGRLVRWCPVVVASSGYLARRGRPMRPSSLDQHALFSVRGETWELGSGPIAPAGPVVLPDQDSAIAAAVAGGGLAQVADYAARPLVARGELEIVLADHAPPPRAFAVSVRDDDPALGAAADALLATIA